MTCSILCSKQTPQSKKTLLFFFPSARTFLGKYAHCQAGVYHPNKHALCTNPHSVISQKIGIILSQLGMPTDIF